MDLPKLSTAPNYLSRVVIRFDGGRRVINRTEAERENDPEWRKNNLEADLRSTDWILKKVREDVSYARRVYSALCKNTFVKNEVLSILKDEKWSCSCRHASEIVANMRQAGDYLDWYGSEQGYEGIVDDEIREDFLKLGWAIRN